MAAIGFINMQDECANKVGGIDFVILFGKDNPHTFHDQDEKLINVNRGMPDYVRGRFTSMSNACCYRVRPSGNNFSTKANIDQTTGQTYFSSTFALRLTGITSQKLKELNSLIRTNHNDGLAAFVHTNSGEWYLTGFYYGLSINSGDGNWGSNIGDGETLTFGFDDLGPYPPIFCEPTVGYLVSDLNEIYNEN